jgi:thioredoxin 1
MPIELTNENFKKEVIDSKETILVDFYAEWCSPCKMLESSIKELKEEYNGKIKVCKADIEKNSNIIKDLDITGVPFVVIFKEGKVVNKRIGLRSKKEIKKDIEDFLL